MSSLDWIEQASCTQHDPEIWFTGKRGPNNDDSFRDAIEICLECPVLIECARWILRVEQGIVTEHRFGIFAGMTPGERMAKEWRTMRRAS